LRRRIVLSRGAIRQLKAIEIYLSAGMSDERAALFVDGILERCDSLVDFPFRGTPRDDLRPDIRTTVYRRRVVIAYSVEATAVAILGIFYGGQDFEAALSADPDIED
jgi:plasmid stabilization system protein ParE